jgi:hypothetical protein
VVLVDDVAMIDEGGIVIISTAMNGPLGPAPSVHTNSDIHNDYC